MKNYFEILECSIKDSDYKFYSKFKELAFPLHPKSDIQKSQKNKDLFIKYCEAYYVLSNKKRKRDYNKIYKHYFNNQPIKINEIEIETILNKFSSFGIQNGNWYYNLSFKDFKKAIPKKRRIISKILDIIEDIITYIDIDI